LTIKNDAGFPPLTVDTGMKNYPKKNGRMAQSEKKVGSEIKI